MGTHEQCESQMEVITKKYEVNTCLKGTASKNSAKNDAIAQKHKQKLTSKSTTQPDYELLANLEDLKHENDALKQKMKEMETNITNYKAKYENANEEIVKHQLTIENLTQKLNHTQDASFIGSLKLSLPILFIMLIFLSYFFFRSLYKPAAETCRFECFSDEQIWQI
jgi:predicted RNase H-like nuclease (RuvC/YqgF family)